MRKYTDEELENMHWKDRWEYEAELESERQAALSEDELVSRLQAGYLDGYYALWDTFTKTGTLQKSALPLWDFLRDHPGEYWMLHRYHCAAALFTILGRPDPDCKDELRCRVQWEHDGEDARQQALLDLRAEIDARLAGA